MPEPVTFATLAKLFATEAGKEFGKQVATELVRLVTSHLASKEALEKAVTEIRHLILVSFAELQEAYAKVDLRSADDRLKAYRNTRNLEDLESANDHIVQARSWYEENRQRDPDFMRRALPLSFKLAVTELAIKAANASRHGNDKGFVEELRRMATWHTTELDAALTKVRAYCAEAVSPVEVKKIERRGRIPVDGAPDIITLYAGNYTVTGSRYPNGRVERVGEYKATMDDAIRDMTVHKQADEARISKEHEDREREVLRPVSEFVAKVKSWRIIANA